MNENAQKREELVEQFRDYQRKVAGWFHQRLGFWRPDDDYTQSEEYQKALKEYRKFKQIDGIDYSPVVQYARELCEHYEAVDKALDDKADSIIRYLGGGSAIVTFGAFLSVKGESHDSRIVGLCALLSLLPSLICALAAVYSAIRVRMPRSAAIFPEVDWARRMAEYNGTKDKTDINIYLMFSPISEAAHYRNVMKAKWLNRAHNFYCATLAGLIVPVIVVSICLASLH
ncbi:MAG: hypothetical protein ACJ8F7_07020 [Gemmataceae bacterium]